MMIAYVDSSVWITKFEGYYAYQNIVEKHLRELEREGWTLCVSEVVLLEVLCKPNRQNKTTLTSLYNQFFTQIDVLSNYDGVFRDALRIASKENLHAIDAIHVAIATHYGCNRFVATDNHFKNITTIPLSWIDLTLIM